ncbi:hypothetical protein D3C76_1156440 [compost metagenome]
MLGKTGSRQLDGGDQLIVGQLVIALRGVAGQAVEVGELDGPRPAPPQDMDHRLQSGQGHTHIGGMGGDTLIAGTENRVDPVQTVPGRATAAGPAFVARYARVIEVITAGALQQVAAGAGHVAQLRRGARQDGLGQQRIAALDPRVPGQVGIAHQGSDHHPAGRGFTEVRQGQAGDVDQVLGTGEVFLHQVQQVGATGDEAGARARQIDGRLHGVGLAVLEGIH